MSHDRVSTNKQNTKKHQHKCVIGQVGGEVIRNISENCPTIKLFREYGAALDAKHDRYERIVKLARDIIIESKRIIFLLHSTGTETPGKRDQILTEADCRLKLLGKKHFKSIALDLERSDPYPFQRAYSAALQEFIEAALFYNYVKTGIIQSYMDMQKTYFEYEMANSSQVEDGTRIVTLLFPMIDFILGLADFTGELMRKSINSLSSGQHVECFKTCEVVRNIQIGFMRVSNIGYRIVGRKFHTLNVSVAKMEHVCYTLRVRGKEVPSRVLMDVINDSSKNSTRNKEDGDEDIDEGIF